MSDGDNPEEDPDEGGSEDNIDPLNVPAFDPRVFDQIMPKFDPTLFDAYVPKFDPTLFDAYVPKFDPTLFDVYVPKFDPAALFDQIMPKIDLDPGISDALLPNLAVFDKQIPWSNLDSLTPTIEALYEDRVSEFETTDAEEELAPLDLRQFTGPAAVALGVVVLFVFVAAGIASPADIRDTLATVVALLGYEDARDYTFHGVVVVVMFALAYSARKGPPPAG